jgi:hypothetical protein
LPKKQFPILPNGDTGSLANYAWLDWNLQSIWMETGATASRGGPFNK